MEPPTCTVLVRVVRTTAAVAIGCCRRDDEAVLLSLPLAADGHAAGYHPPDQGAGDGGDDHDLPGGELSHWCPPGVAARHG